MTVAISNPPPKADASKQPSIERSSNSFSREPKPRTEAKPRLTFIPTSVQRNITKPVTSAGDSNGSDKKATQKSNDDFRQLLAKK